MNQQFLNVIIALLGLSTSFSAVANIDRVRVLNDTKETVAIHLGGFSNAVAIEPGKWKIFRYPFEIVPTGSTKMISTSLLVASAGGKWVTSPVGYTHLANPDMMLCLDYRAPQYNDKNGNRLWEIKEVGGFDKGCQVQGYKEPWYQGNQA